MMKHSWLHRVVFAAGVPFVLLSAGSCSSDNPVQPPPSSVDCDGTSTAVVNLEPLQGTTITGDALKCIALAGNGAHYLLMPQLMGPLPYGGYGYRIGAPPTVALKQRSLAAPQLDRAIEPNAMDAQTRFDARLRSREAVGARAIKASSYAPRRNRSLDQSVATATIPVVGSVRNFHVLSHLEDPLRFANVSAALRYAGNNIFLYVDTLAGNSLNSAEFTAFGKLFDENLYGVDRAAFGAESDIDGNGHVIGLLSPTVNSLVTAADCATQGYVRGFFFSDDLASTDTSSNKGEVFYGYVPDPTGRWSCAHPASDVTANLPPTFVHEFQHMISFNEHVIARGGDVEEPWLNEGMSHLAEELGSVYYEQKFPPPAGRTNASQLFPDSASAFITPNLVYAYRYLYLSNAYSADSCAPGTFCSLPERAATWLFLRWLGDQKGADVFRKLEQTSNVGATNVTNAAGEPMPALFGDFTLALWADSLPGVPRTAVPSRYRFSSRNLRSLFDALYRTYGISVGVTRSFPLDPVEMAPDESITGTMRPGTFMIHELTIPQGEPPARIRLSAPDGTLFSALAGAQLSILRLP